jgi:hypothetical protein
MPCLPGLRAAAFFTKQMHSLTDRGIEAHFLSSATK